MLVKPTFSHKPRDGFHRLKPCVSFGVPDISVPYTNGG